jgi:UDP-N-acetylmuramate--alanine ligase
MLHKTHYFIIGIKGMGMVNLALILKQMGKEVTGSDTHEHYPTDAVLTAHSIPFITSFSPEDLPSETLVVIYSAAHRGTHNPQVIEAKKRGITVISQPAFLGELLKQFEISIGVSGCHGKTTTASILAFVLKKLQVKPSYFIGTPTYNDNWGGSYDGKKYFVVEADEYGVDVPRDITPKFHFLNPDYCITTNIDFDHPDVYKTIEETKAAFLTFFQQILAKNGKNPRLFLCADDEKVMDVASHLSPNSFETFGFAKNATLQISNLHSDEEFSRFNLMYKGKDLGEFRLSLFGEKSASNAAGVVLSLIHFGFDIEKVKESLPEFIGAKRRFEKVAVVNDGYLFDDYGHHPNEIKATIQAARSRFPDKNIIVIFQPHTYSRTQSLKDEFVTALSLADQALIAPIFASARENADDFHITSQQLEQYAVEKGITNVKGFATKADLLAHLQDMKEKGVVVFTMGAGDVYKMKEEIIERL